MTTIGELITQVRDMLDEPAAAQWTDPMLVRWLNEANRDLARSTRHLKDTITQAVTGGVGTYTLDATVLSVEHAYWTATGDTRKVPLMPRHFEGMDDVWGQYQNQTSGSPDWFTVLGFSPSAELRIFPTPVGTGTLTLIVAKLPTEIDSASYTSADVVDTPTSWYDALVDYCEYKGLRRDRDPRWQEARQLYMEKRDGLINTADHMAVNREMVPSPTGGYMDAWLVEFD